MRAHDGDSGSIFSGASHEDQHGSGAVPKRMARSASANRYGPARGNTPSTRRRENDREDNIGIRRRQAFEANLRIPVQQNINHRAETEWALAIGWRTLF